jgi:hypothetical protein
LKWYFICLLWQFYWINCNKVLNFNLN